MCFVGRITLGWSEEEVIRPREPSFGEEGRGGELDLKELRTGDSALELREVRGRRATPSHSSSGSSASSEDV